jgi:hypothetical protein
MPWICETCGRSFNRKGQSHSCSSRTLDNAFSGEKAKWRELYSELRERTAARVGEFTEYCPSVGVMWKHTSTFAEAKFKKDCMEVAFYSDRLRPERNPVKWLQTSANRTAHLITVTDNNNFDEIIDWIAESYALTRR